MNMYDIPDHPVIQNMERTGYPDGKEPEYPTCPVCHTEQTTQVYKDIYGDLKGCDACVLTKDAENVPAFMTGQKDDPICPVCKKPCETAYLDTDKDPIGCDQCISAKDAWEEETCFEQKGEPYGNDV